MKAVLKGILLQGLVLIWFFILAFLARGDTIDDLNSDKYAVRQKAMAELSRNMNFQTYFKLRKAKDLPLEATRRVEKVMRDFESKVSGNYKVDLGNYPDYPWVGWGLANNYKWRGFEPHEIRSVFLVYAHQEGIPCDNSPNWSDWRHATKLWLETRIVLKVNELLSATNSEKEFTCQMDCEMQDIQDDITLMIKGDDDWWFNRNEPNPLRNKKPDF